MKSKPLIFSLVTPVTLLGRSFIAATEVPFPGNLEEVSLLFDKGNHTRRGKTWVFSGSWNKVMYQVGHPSTCRTPCPSCRALKGSLIFTFYFTSACLALLSLKKKIAAGLKTRRWTDTISTVVFLSFSTKRVSRKANQSFQGSSECQWVLSWA